MIQGENKIERTQFDVRSTAHRRMGKFLPLFYTVIRWFSHHTNKAFACFLFIVKKLYRSCGRFSHCDTIHPSRVEHNEICFGGGSVLSAPSCARASYPVGVPDCKESLWFDNHVRHTRYLSKKRLLRTQQWPRGARQALDAQGIPTQTWSASQTPMSPTVVVTIIILLNLIIIIVIVSTKSIFVIVIIKKQIMDIVRGVWLFAGKSCFNAVLGNSQRNNYSINFCVFSGFIHLFSEQ